MNDSDKLMLAHKVVTMQAADEGLWFIPKYITEAYLQQALRTLHAAIEGKTSNVCALAILDTLMEDDQKS